jgi:hypothetical protein
MLSKYSTYRVIVRYNSLLYNHKKNNYLDCIKKSDEILNLMNGKVNHTVFHLNYARYHYLVGYEL